MLTFTGNRQGVYMAEVNSHQLYAPVHIPHGARITGITAWVHDTEPTIDIRFRLLRKAPTSVSAFTAGTEVTVSGSAGFMNETATSLHLVNNATPLFSGSQPHRRQLARGREPLIPVRAFHIYPRVGANRDL